MKNQGLYMVILGAVLIAVLGILIFRDHLNLDSGKQGKASQEELIVDGSRSTHGASSSQSSNSELQGVSDNGASFASPEKSTNAPASKSSSPSSFPEEPGKGDRVTSSSQSGAYTDGITLPGESGSEVTSGTLHLSKEQVAAATQEGVGESTSEASEGVDNGEYIEGEDGNEGDEVEMVRATVAGTVVRGENPVVDARLNLFNTDRSMSFDATTNNTGYYVFTNLEPGAYTLYLTDPASPNNRRTFSLEENERRLSEDFIVPQLPPVTGRVVRASNGEPVPGASVEVWQNSRIIGSVNGTNEGAYQLFPLDPGSYKLIARAEGFLPGEKSIFLEDDFSAGGLYEEIELEQSTTIAGVVLSENGGPVSAARVGLFSGSIYHDPLRQLGEVYTSPDGVFEISVPDGLNVSTARAGVYKSGYVPAYSDSFALNQQGEQGNVSVVLTLGGGLSGLVVDSETNPVEGASVKVQSGFPTGRGILDRFSISLPEVVTDSSGAFVLTYLEPGETAITVSSEGFVPFNGDFTVPGQGVADIGQVTLESEDEKKPGRIFGIIYDELGTPMRNHSITVQNRSNYRKTTSTDSRGGFVLDDVPAGQYAIFTNGSLLRGDNFMTVDQVHPFAESGGEQIVLLYDLGQGVRFSLEDQAGQPITSCIVGVDVANYGQRGYEGYRELTRCGFRDRAYQSSTGQYFIDHLIYGDLTLTVAVDGYGSKTISDQYIPVGQELSVGVITLEGGGLSIYGKVIDARSSYSLEGVEIRAIAPPGSPSDHPLNQYNPSGYTDSGGEFQISGIPSGSFSLNFSKSGYASQTESGFDLDVGSAHDLGTFNLQAAAIVRGRITNPQSQPLSDIRVTIQGITRLTDSDGHYYFDNVQPGSGSIRVLDPKGIYESAERSVNFPPENPLVEDFVLNQLSQRFIQEFAP